MHEVILHIATGRNVSRSTAFSFDTRLEKRTDQVSSMIGCCILRILIYAVGVEVSQR